MIVPNKLFILGNWKMKPATRAEAVAVAKKISSGNTSKVEVAIIPPALFLSDIQKNISAMVSYGIQDISWEETGSCNAELSATQAKSVGCDYAIVGHSSRRALGETDDSVNKKIQACIAHDIIPIVCIGESERDTQGAYIDFLRNQIQASFKALTKEQFEHIVIAYEPLWAIGATAAREATAQEAEEVRILIEKTIDEMTGNIPVGRITIVYGGSVNNADQFNSFLDAGMKGVLVGRASIEPEAFNSLIACAQNRK